MVQFWFNSGSKTTSQGDREDVVEWGPGETDKK
jgi:hypothetical protein